MHPPGPEYRFDDDARELFARLANRLSGAFDIVVLRQHIVKRDVHFVMSRWKLHDAAVIGASEYHDLAATRDHAGCGERHDAGFGARVAKAQLLNGGEPLANQAGKFPFQRGRSAHHNSEVQCLAHGRLDGFVGMAKQSGGEFANEIDVPVTVEVHQLCPFPPNHGQRERLKVQHVPRISARQITLSLVIGRFAARIGAGVPRPGVVESLMYCFHIHRCA